MRTQKRQIQVNKSSVEAVDEAQRKQKEAEKKMEQAETKARNERKRAELEIQKARKKAKREIEDMKENQYFWTGGYITVILFSIIQNGAFQRDILQFVKKPMEWWLEYVKWFENLEYLEYSAGEVSISLIAVLGNVIRVCIPINLLVLMLLLNSLIVGIRMYMEKKKFL